MPKTEETKKSKMTKPQDADGKKKFEFLDIAPADAAFQAYGKDLGDVFANSALAVMDIIVDVTKVEPKDVRTVEAQGYDLKSLLFDFLNELIFAIATENVIFSKFEVKVDEMPDSMKDVKYKLSAQCWGEKLDFTRHGFKAEAKAITYHQMDVRQEGKRWIAKVVVDL
jgi:SHS2 domain-containing protein